MESRGWRIMHGCLSAIAMTAPAPCGLGRRPKARAGWGLSIELYVIETGEGEYFPLPVGPTPGRDIHHGPVCGEAPVESHARLSTWYRHDCPRPLWAGEERRRRGRGGGLSIELYVIETGGKCFPLPRARYPPRSTVRGDAGKTSCTAVHRLSLRTIFRAMDERPPRAGLGCD